MLGRARDGRHGRVLDRRPRQGRARYAPTCPGEYGICICICPVFIGAAPHQAVDAIVTACTLVTSMQTIVSRNKDPLESGVVTFGTINGGYTHNIIADQVTLCGTARSFTPQVQGMIETRMGQICCGMGQCFGGSVSLTYERKCLPYSPVYIRTHRLTRGVYRRVPSDRECLSRVRGPGAGVRRGGGGGGEHPGEAAHHGRRGLLLLPGAAPRGILLRGRGTARGAQAASQVRVRLRRGVCVLIMHIYEYVCMYSVARGVDRRLHICYPAAQEALRQIMRCGRCVLPPNCTVYKLRLF